MNVSVRKVVQQLSVKVLPAMLKKNKLFWRAFIYIFEVCLKWSKYIMVNASDKIWINENDIVKELLIPDITSRARGNHYKFDSELWLINA